MAFHGAQHPFLNSLCFLWGNARRTKANNFKFKLAINGHLALGNKKIQGGRYQSQVSFWLLVFGEICFCYFREKEVLCFLPTSVREWRQQSKDLPTTRTRNSHRLLFRCITHPPDLSLELLQTCNFGFSRLREFVFLGKHVGSLKCQRMRKNQQ